MQGLIIFLLVSFASFKLLSWGLVHAMRNSIWTIDFAMKHREEVVLPSDLWTGDPWLCAQALYEYHKNFLLTRSDNGVVCVLVRKDFNLALMLYLMLSSTISIVLNSYAYILVAMIITLSLWFKPTRFSLCGETVYRFYKMLEPVADKFYDKVVYNLHDKANNFIYPPKEEEPSLREKSRVALSEHYQKKNEELYAEITELNERISKSESDYRRMKGWEE